MKKCEVVTFETPNTYLLNGLWFGSDKAKKGFIFLHGLTSSAFAHHDTLLPLVDDKTGALFFNNRGHNKIGKVHKLSNNENGYESELIGEAHEIFTDCVDDIDGAINFLHEKGVEDIYLVGHSTGCQKSIYYLSQKDKQQSISGAVLICPMSDYAYVAAYEDPKELTHATQVAKDLVKRGKSHELLPLEVWSDLEDAQRFLSLYSPDSEEEIFLYSQPEKKPDTFKKIVLPILVILAEKDEYTDRPMNEIADWFKKETSSGKLETQILKNTLHGLADHEHDVAQTINKWL